MDIKKPKFAEYFKRSKELFENNNYKDALKYIKKAKCFENSFDYWILSCEIYLSLNKFEEADESISKAIHINNNSAKAWYLKAKSSIGLMNYKKALRASKRAISIKPDPEFIELNQNINKFLNVTPEDIDTFANTTEPSVDFNYTNKEDNMVTLVKTKNIQLLSQKKLTHSIYYSILDKVMDDVINKMSVTQEDIYSKIKTFAQYFVDLNYKSEGEAHGTYIFNTVKVDNRLLTSQQIAALIHELAHHLLSEIFEQALMYIFNSIKTDTIEALAWYAISQKPEWLLMNEYCAHTVECYYMPYDGYNYESFNRLLNDQFNLNDPEDFKTVKMAAKIGNTFAQDIIYMLNKFFTDDLKNEIKVEYVKDRLFYTRYFGCEFLTDETFAEEYKLNLITQILKNALVDIKLNFSYSQIFYFKQSFNKANRKI